MAQPTTFQLPFRGSWFVFWGGNTKKLNHHHDDQAQKYALDLIILDTKGNTHTNKGSKNKDYYAYGQDVLAPAQGIVVEAVDGFLDNVPQKTTNNYAYPGNHVIIKHQEKLYSCLAHLKTGSLKVKNGQVIKCGQKIGECGNSGNSSEPHLHFHVMDSCIWTRLDKNYKHQPAARSLKPYFKSLMVERNNQTIVKNNYSPVKGYFIRPAS